MENNFKLTLYFTVIHFNHKQISYKLEKLIENNKNLEIIIFWQYGNCKKC